MRLPVIIADLRPVVILSVQQPPHILEHPRALYALRFVFPHETEIRLCTLSCNHDVPPLPPHLCILVAMSCPMMLYETPHWHINTVQVTAGQRILPLLYHCHPQTELSIHEMLV